MRREELSRGVLFEAVLIGLYTNWLINMFWEAPFAEGDWLLSGGMWLCFTFGIWNLIRYFMTIPRVGSRATLQIFFLALMSVLHHRIVGDVGLLNLMTKYYLGAMLLAFIVRFDPHRVTPMSIEFLLGRNTNRVDNGDDDGPEDNYEDNSEGYDNDNDHDTNDENDHDNDDENGDDDEDERFE